ncbi:MAG: hypothetical protein M3Q19_13380 [Pseudomonadota bacterium]|nr:hypothetical protein [Pseudomonadota bacterium]
MGLLSILTIFLITSAAFFWMGNRRLLLVGAGLLVGAAALSIYTLSGSVPADLNEADRMGNAAARLIIVVLSASSAAAFFAGYIFSVLRLRKSQTVARVESE